MDWQVADAKNRFSELMTQALTKGPQRVRRRKQAVVILAEEEYLALLSPRPTLKDYLLSGPDLSELDLTRDRSAAREASTVNVITLGEIGKVVAMLPEAAVAGS